MNSPKSNKKRRGSNEIDWIITLLPLVIVTGIAALLLTFPQRSMKVIDTLWSIFVNKLGFFYILLGFGLVCTAFYLAFSKYGKIRLGNLEKPRYSNFAWGSMIFTSTMAADILYWSLIEWGYYYTASPFGQKALTAAERQDWAATYPLFHWGITPWSFHIVCAVAFGYMLHVRQRKKQKLSEACRPLFGNKIDGVLGTIIDVFSVVGLLAGTATTFSLATPLLSLAISTISGIPESRELTLVVLCIIAAVYTSAVLLGIKGISHLAKIAVVCFSSLIVFVFFAQPQALYYRNEHNRNREDAAKLYFAFYLDGSLTDFRRKRERRGVPAAVDDFLLGILDRMVCCHAVLYRNHFGGTNGTEYRTGRPYMRHRRNLLFVHRAGKLRTLFGNARIITGSRTACSRHRSRRDYPQHFETLPLAKVVLVLLIITMIALYASTFDAITMVIASYSQRQLEGREPKKVCGLFGRLSLFCCRRRSSSPAVTSVSCKAYRLSPPFRSALL